MRVPRGRNLFTKAAVRRAIDAARECGVDRLEIDSRDGRIILTGITTNKQGRRKENDRPEDIVELLK
jgi:hypothetical protein